MSLQTHEEIMSDDGYTIMSKGRHAFSGRANVPKSMLVIGSGRNAKIAVDQATLALKEYQNFYLSNLITMLKHAIGPRRSVNTMRAIGMGNFSEHGSDSALQMAVFNQLREHFKCTQCFYQEPRCSSNEENYLKQLDIKILPTDSLQKIPECVQEAIKTNETDVNLVFMIHFDHYGFKNILDSYHELNVEKTLVFVGNTLPTDYVGNFKHKLRDFNRLPVLVSPSFPKTQNLSQKAMNWWRKAFVYTDVVYCKYVIVENK